MVREQCTAPTKGGQPCQAFALPGEAVCWSHLPGNQGAVKDAQRRGGANRSAARRAAKIWAAAGKQIRPQELPDLLRGCILRVATGQMEPSQASVIATLAKASVQLTAELELEQRIAALEAAAGMNRPSNIRRVK
jgi:hypothetical protein